MEILKSTVTKKVIVYFDNLGEENFFCNIFNFHKWFFFRSFKIYQRFKGHFLNKFHVSFNNYSFEFTLTETSEGGNHLYTTNYLSYKCCNDQKIYEK